VRDRITNHEAATINFVFNCHSRHQAEAFGATPTVVGFLVTTFAAEQFIMAPLLGCLSDQCGRRPVLLFSVLGTFFGFLFLRLAEPLGNFAASIFAA